MKPKTRFIRFGTEDVCFNQGFKTVLDPFCNITRLEKHLLNLCRENDLFLNDFKYSGWLSYPDIFIDEDPNKEICYQIRCVFKLRFFEIKDEDYNFIMLLMPQEETYNIWEMIDNNRNEKELVLIK